MPFEVNSAFVPTVQTASNEQKPVQQTLKEMILDVKYCDALSPLERGHASSGSNSAILVHISNKKPW